jgi:hypothetical protein
MVFIFHDSTLSGKTHLRNMKATKLYHLPGGRELRQWMLWAK